MNKRQKKKAFKKRIITMNSSISIGIHMPVKNSRNNKKENQAWLRFDEIFFGVQNPLKLFYPISIGYSDGI